ncbi:MAG: hypothetical protein C0596_09450 [Marinilabiliales bacterium]|nr:MAG: hypothetical protein C0596_09450 [Marinilabiliales bacterium]
MFEFNFRDERYLPFEGAGAVGKWSIELPNAIRKFDYESISDVILHVKYTARDAGGTLKAAAEENIEDNFNQLMEVLGDTNSKLLVAHSLKSEFADAIYELINSTEGTLEISEKHFPYIFRNWASKYGKAITISSIKLMSDTDYSNKLFVGATTGWTTESLPFYYNGISVPTPSDGVWSVDLNSANFDGNNDVYLVIEFSFV